MNGLNVGLESKHTANASVLPTENGYRLTIPSGNQNRYRLAQLDDYAKFTRKRFPAQPPRTLSLRARASDGRSMFSERFSNW